MAKFLADKLAEQSLLQRVQLHSSGATILGTYFQHEVDLLKDKVKTARQALHDYEVTHKADGIAQGGNKTDLSSTRLQDLNAQYMKAIADETMLAERYGENHPKLIQARKLVELLHNEVMKAQERSPRGGRELHWLRSVESGSRVL